MRLRSPFLPVLAAAASLALLPSVARGERLRGFELRLESMLAPLPSSGTTLGSFQFLTLASSLEPAPSVFVGFGFGIGYRSGLPWPVLQVDGSGPAFSGDAFLRFKSAPSEGRSSAIGVSVELTGGRANGAGNTVIAAWFDLLLVLDISSEFSLLFGVSPGVAAVSFDSGTSDVRPVLKLTSGVQL